MSVENARLLGQTEYPASFQNEVQRAVAPSAAQEQRRARLRRFNRWVIFLPMSLILLAWITLIVGLAWLTIAGDWFAMDTNQSYYRQLVSGVADVLTMLILVPLLLICATPTVGLAAFLVMRRRRAKVVPAGETSLPLFWRIENVIISVHDAVARSLPRIARPVIEAHAVVAFVKRLIVVVRRTISQEIIGNGENR